MNVPVVLYVINREERRLGDTTAGALAAVRLQCLTPAALVPFFSVSAGSFQVALPAVFLSAGREVVLVMSGFAASRGGPSVPGHVARFELSHN